MSDGSSTTKDRIHPGAVLLLARGAVEYRLFLSYPVRTCGRLPLVFAGSSNGRTTASGAVYLGSSPSPAAKNSAAIFCCGKRDACAARVLDWKSGAMPREYARPRGPALRIFERRREKTWWASPNPAAANRLTRSSCHRTPPYPLAHRLWSCGPRHRGDSAARRAYRASSLPPETC